MSAQPAQGQAGSGTEPPADPNVDLIIVGAGFAGLYMLHRARGLGLRARVFEAGDGVGGTWYWNRYPGARCDVESLEYSYQFSDDLQQQWHWTERFAPQPEILKYANHVADRFDLRRDIAFETRVTQAHFDEASARWQVRTDRGDALSSQFVVMATGCLSSTNLPRFPGLEDFQGERYHTGEWPHQPVDFTGKRVAVIGTGSSAIQSIPIIARQAASLTVFQRTANFSIPAYNAPLDPAHEAAIKAEYPAFRARNSQMMAGFGSSLPRNEAPALAATPEERRRRFDERWNRGGLGFTGAFNDLMISREANDLAAEYVRERIRAIVEDPATAELLAPRQVIGCKRICVDSGYYETFNLPHVKLVDISAGGIEAITATGVKAGGQEYPVDCIVFATGFDAMTGSLLKIDIRGRDGLALREAWSAGPRTYLGLNVAGFPNLFTVSGPGSPSVLTNMIVSIEQHVNWIADCIAWLRAGGRRTIEAEPQAQDAWVGHVNAVAGGTLFPTCNSWYLGANVPGKTRVFMPLLGFPAYVQRCEEVVARGYEGFRTAA
ncbi:MAG: NAD(P)/FAD-dependent oxidoreductase [Burkholderiales bacterium]|nr:NAD(P)/FAD-dependent oxidoreductase [Burkholderiales bacterium]